MAQLSRVDEYGYPLAPDTKRRWRTTGIRASKGLLRSSVFLLISLFGGLLKLRRLGKQSRPLNPASFHPRHILIIRLDLIGDLVLSLTVVQALKRTYPEAEIDLLAMPSTAPVVQPDPDLTTVLTYNPNTWRRPKALFQPRNWREARTLLRQLRARDYDLAISVFGEWAAIIAALSNARRSVGFRGEGYPGLLTDPVPGRHWLPGSQKHEVDYCLELARAAGATPDPADRVPRLDLSPQALNEVEALLTARHVRSERPLIACHVSSNNGQSKRWPIPYWARLIDRLIREDLAQVVLTGAPADLPLIETILQRTQTRDQVINLAGQTSLAQLAALLKLSNLLISGDSGPMHIAAAVGTPLIAIHGPTDPAHSGPISSKATILRSDIWCSPCYNATASADCRFFTTQCMRDITPEQVLQIALQKVAGLGSTLTGQNNHAE